MYIGFYLYKGANLAEKKCFFLEVNKKYIIIGEMDQPKFCTVLMMVYILRYSSYFGVFPVPVI